MPTEGLLLRLAGRGPRSSAYDAVHAPPRMRHSQAADRRESGPAVPSFHADWRSVLLCLGGLVSLVAIAAAQGGREPPKLLEEFLTAEPCYVQTRGEFEFSAAFDYRKPAADWRIPLLLEYGITDRLEAEVEGGYVSLPGAGSREGGPGDMELGLLYALRPGVGKVAVTVGAALGLPTGDESKGLGSGKIDVELLGIAGMPLGRAELHVTGMLEIEDEAEPGLNAAAVYPRGDFRFTLEANVLRGTARTRTVEQELADEPGEGEAEETWVVLTPGLIHRPGPELEYGIGVPIGLTDTAPDWGIIGRLTIEL